MDEAKDATGKSANQGDKTSASTRSAGGTREDRNAGDATGARDTQKAAGEKTATDSAKRVDLTGDKRTRVQAALRSKGDNKAPHWRHRSSRVGGYPYPSRSAKTSCTAFATHLPAPMLLRSRQEERMDKNRRDTIFIAAYLAVTVAVGTIVWALSDYAPHPRTAQSEENVQTNITPAP